MRGAQRPRSVLVGPATFFVLLATACTPQPPAEPRPLWDDEVRWVRVEDGWARTVPLGALRTVPASRGERLRAVVFPTSGPATVTLDTAGGERQLHLTRPQAIDLELGGPATLAAAPPVELLRPRVTGGEERRGRRILLAVADTLRFDHADEEHMPEVWNYFSTGTRFLHAYSPASWTLPSLASVFTGQLPSRLRSPGGTLISLAPGAPTLASELHRRGYVTVAATANYTVNHENGFSAGFDLFYAPRPAGEGEALELPDARWVAARARESAAWFAGEDVFLYFQFMDPHEPYRNHENGRTHYAPAVGQEPDAETLAALRAAYASEVRHLSRQLGSLLADLGELDLAVFTADHGEEFFDHRGFHHGSTLYDEVVRVPLWVRGAGCAARTLREPVSLVAVKDLVLEGRSAALPPRVTIETFAHGPPRWSGIVDRSRAIYFARQLVPQGTDDPTHHWLAEIHPRMSWTRLERSGAPGSGHPGSGHPGSGRPIDPGSEQIRRSVSLLLEHFAGHRRGLFLLFEGSGHPGRDVTLEISGVGGDGLWWGDAAHLEVAAADPAQRTAGELEVEVREPRPFALLFLPSPETGEEPPRVVDRSTGEPLAVAPIAAADPARRSPGAVAAWYDSGRPPSVLRGAEETLERLRALGYI